MLKKNTDYFKLNLKITNAAEIYADVYHTTH